MKTKLVYLFSLTAAFLFTSCNNDDDAVVDTVDPVIQINEPHMEDEFARGGQIHFLALLTDNVALASYKIEIHEDFDDHTHGFTKSQDNPWSYEEVFTLPPGLKVVTVDHHIDIPEIFNGSPISEGAYHFGVFLTDAAGNETQAFVDIHIEDVNEDFEN